MQRQIIKVNDIHKAIQETGLEYYVDRLLQDANGDYYWVEHNIIGESESESVSMEAPSGWAAYRLKLVNPYGQNEPDEPVEYYYKFYRYRILEIPKEVAWFCIDALKLQSDVLGIGSGEYEGPHGGKLTYCNKSDGDDAFKEISADIVRVEEL